MPGLGGYAQGEPAFVIPETVHAQKRRIIGIEGVDKIHQISSDRILADRLVVGDIHRPERLMREATDIELPRTETGGGGDRQSGKAERDHVVREAGVQDHEGEPVAGEIAVTGESLCAKILGFSLRAEIIWTVGKSAADDSIHTRLDEESRVGFFIENGGNDVLLTSEESVADGRWHHLATCWSANIVSLFIDGRRVAWEFADRDLLHGELPELRMGGGLYQKDAVPFNGEIAEVAVWDRALSPVEIDQQFRTARGESLEGGVFPE